MSKIMSDYEEKLVELVHFLSRGSKKHQGLSLKEVKELLYKPIISKRGMNSLQCLETEGRSFINELKTFINELED